MNSLKKTRRHLSIIALLLVACPVVFADFYAVGSSNAESSAQNSSSDVLTQIKKDIEDIEQYLGFSSQSNPDKPLDSNKVTSSDTNLLVYDDAKIKSPSPFMSINHEFSSAANLLSIFSTNREQSSFIPPILPIAKFINTLANQLFTLVPANNSFDVQYGKQQTQTNQTDNEKPPSPVSQQVLNILSMTPYDLNAGDKFTYTDLGILASALGLAQKDNFVSDTNKIYKLFKDYNISDPDVMFPQTTGTNPQLHILSQVDSSVFLSTLMYDNTSNNNPGGAAVCPGINCGLGPDTNQLNNAVNFVRHVTGTVLPPLLPSGIVLNNNFVAANSGDVIGIKNLSAFIVGSRVYAARQSVGLQNIYEILARRMPMQSSDGKSSSQALNEFIMATSRLFKADESTPGPSTWQNNINTASSTTVQKETALLLAEINYQMYLMRQQQERLVLTNSLLLISNLQYPQLEDRNISR